MKRILRHKQSGKEWRIVEPSEFEGYERNRPGDKWELVEASDGSGMKWIGVNPEFVEIVERES